MKDEFILTQDNDCHNYVIPADKEDEWEDWLGTEEADSGILPTWVVEVGGSRTLVKFKQYRIE